MFCHISCRVCYADPFTFADIRATLPCESPLGVGSVQGLLTQLYPKALEFKDLKIHNEEENKKP